LAQAADKQFLSFTTSSRNRKNAVQEVGEAHRRAHILRGIAKSSRVHMVKRNTMELPDVLLQLKNPSQL